MYRCVGNDNWVALTVRSGEEWKQVAELIGRPDLAADESLQELAASPRPPRRARRGDLGVDRRVEQYEVAQMLQARGVPAAPVLANWQIMADPHVFQRGLYETILHPVVGAYPTDDVAVALRADAGAHRAARPRCSPSTTARSSPRPASPTTTIAALYETGTTADEPVPAE